ncbi:helix-turn-helix domain-containing protein [Streptomyces sp. NPDC048718]|uniref:helix-turn-helix domain-containing protein n=1 Tax=Streptomyces sp. NPDC048718 TaxID=3365587 RepID=UPI003712809A
MAYARRHLTGPDLTPDRLAHEHAVSRRQLYAVLGRAGISLEQWVISERPEAARRLLVSPRHAGLAVFAVAARCGFTSPRHIARRFRERPTGSPRVNGDGYGSRTPSGSVPPWGVDAASPSRSHRGNREGVRPGPKPGTDALLQCDRPLVCGPGGWGKVTCRTTRCGRSASRRCPPCP